LKRELRQSNIIYNREIREIRTSPTYVGENLDGRIRGIRGKKKKKTKIPKKTFS